jgi:mannose-6-phosphate isomerase-like protein (cupin superfamily)
VVRKEVPYGEKGCEEFLYMGHGDLYRQVPHHNANSNVTLMVVHGEGTFHIGNEVTRMGPGKLLRVPFQSPMSIKNESKERLAFLVIKTPHPNEM